MSVEFPRHRPPVRLWPALREVLRHGRRLVAPDGSRRHAVVQGLRGALRRLTFRLGRLPAALPARLGTLLGRSAACGDWSPPPLPADPPPPLVRHGEAVDIIVCVHNALDDVRRCLESVVRTTFPPYRLILVDDGSGSETAAYLAAFAASQGATLLRNEVPRGYTCAANQGLRAARGEFAVLLNSDTVTTHEWLDRLLACARSDSRIGLVGPLSNTASWQSVPEVFGPDGDWARNPLPSGFDPETMALAVHQWSARLYPRLPFLNGFCLLLRRRMLEEVGLLDEETFPLGYGEENDLCLRAAAASWSLAVAEDAYVFHAQSRSYSDHRRRTLAAATDRALVAKHGAAVIEAGVGRCRFDPVLAAMRARLALHLATVQERAAILERWEGRRLLLVLAVEASDARQAAAFAVAFALLHLGIDARLALPAFLRPEEVPAGLRFPGVVYSSTDEPPDLARFNAVVGSEVLLALGPVVDLAVCHPGPSRPAGRVRLAVSLASADGDKARAATAAQLVAQLLSRHPDRFEAVGLGSAPAASPRRAPKLARYTGPLSFLQHVAWLRAVDVVVDEGTGADAAQWAATAMACGAVVVGSAVAALRKACGVAASVLPAWLEEASSATLQRLAEDRHLVEELRCAGIAASATWAAQRVVLQLVDQLDSGRGREGA